MKRSLVRTLSCISAALVITAGSAFGGKTTPTPAPTPKPTASPSPSATASPAPSASASASASATVAPTASPSATTTTAPGQAKKAPTPKPVDGRTDWTGTTNTTFSTGTNWTAVSGSAPPVAGDVAWFSSTPTNKTVNLTTSPSLAGLYFTGTGASGYSLTRTSPNAYTLTGSASAIGTEVSDATAVAIGAENTSGTNSIAAPITLAPGSGTTSTFFQAGGGILDLSSATTAISGSGITLNLTGSGTIRLNNNTYSGGTSVNGTILEIAASSTQAGGVVTSGPVGTGTLTLNDGSTLRSNNATGRDLRNSVVSSGSITLGAASTQTGTLTFGTASVTIPPTWTLAADTTLITNVATTINPVISGGFGLTKDGAAALTLGATNTYTGDTVIKAGTINIGTTQTLGSTSTPGTLKLSGGTLNTTNSRSVTTAAIPNNVSVTADSAITTTSTAGTVDLNFTGTVTGTGGTLTLRNDAASGTGVFEVRFSTGDNTMSQPIVIANGSAGTTRLSDFNITGTTHIYNGVISGTGSYRRTVSSGAGGTTIFNANNTYTGTTTINGGTLQINNTNAASSGRISGTSGITLNTGGTLLLNGSSSWTDRVNDSATVTMAGGTFNTGGLSEHGASNNTAGMGALTLTNSSIIDLGSGASIVAFANSSLATWTAAQTLSIWNWSGTPLTGGGTDQLYFGNSLTGLTAAQLLEITFYSDSGTTSLGTAIILANGEVVPIPETSTWVIGALALGAIGFTQRKRFSKS